MKHSWWLASDECMHAIDPTNENQMNKKCEMICKFMAPKSLCLYQMCDNLPVQNVGWSSTLFYAIDLNA